MNQDPAISRAVKTSTSPSYCEECSTGLLGLITSGRAAVFLNYLKGIVCIRLRRRSLALNEFGDSGFKASTSASSLYRYGIAKDFMALGNTVTLFFFFVAKPGLPSPQATIAQYHRLWFLVPNRINTGQVQNSCSALAQSAYGRVWYKAIYCHLPHIVLELTHSLGRMMYEQCSATIRTRL